MRLLFIFGLAVLFLSGCKEVKQLQNEVAALRVAVDTNWKATIQAIPGERWMQLRDALDEPCESYPAPQERTACLKRRQLAQDTLQRIARFENVDPTRQYEASIWIEFDADDSEQAISNIGDIDFVRVLTTQVEDVNKALAEGRFRRNLLLLPDQARRPLTDAEVSAVVETELNAILRRLYRPTYQPKNFGSGASVSQSAAPAIKSNIESILEPRPEACAEPTLNYQQTADIQAACAEIAFQKFVVESSDHLTTAILSPFSVTAADERVSLRITKPWGVMDAEQVMAVIIEEDDWERISMLPNFAIWAQVHIAGDPASRYALTPQRISVPIDRFSRETGNQAATIKIIRDNGKPIIEKYRWSSVNMTDHAYLSGISVAELEATRKALAALYMEQN